MAKRNNPGTSKKRKNRQRQAQRDPNLAQQLREKEEQRIAQKEGNLSDPPTIKEKSAPRKAPVSTNPTIPKESRDSGRWQRRATQVIVFLMALALVGTMAITALAPDGGW